VRRLGPANEFDGRVSGLGELRIGLPGRPLHVGEQLVVVDLRRVVVLDVPVFGIRDDDAPSLGREHAQRGRHDHAEGLGAGWIAPRAEHDLRVLRVEVPEVGGQVESGKTAGQCDAARPVAELRFDLVARGMGGRALEALRASRRGRGEERHDQQKQGRSVQNACTLLA